MADANNSNNTKIEIAIRPRRNRSSPAMRGLVREVSVSAANLVLPLFVREGTDVKVPISSMPGCYRMSIDHIVKTAAEAYELGVGGIALFPVVDDNLKTPKGEESWNPEGLLQRCVREIKKNVPGILVITDVALDPYSSDGHDGYVLDGKIDNDITLPLLAKMAIAQAQAGADMVAPSDMMDGRIGYIRKALDDAGYTNVGICSYCVKYASCFYGPFREALDSAPRAGDKKTYQMDPCNGPKEALRELRLDEAEGADWVMVKPGMPYLDIVHLLSQNTTLPVAIYHISGEYAMLKAAALQGWLDYEKALMESLISMRRAGANIIFTYGAIDAARLLKQGWKF